MELLPGDIVDGRYAIHREIARGGMCTVYSAYHRFTGRHIALKAPSADHEDVPAVAKRLLREARALEAARHRNVVDVLDAGDTPQLPAYLVMEMLDGRSLEGILAARKTIPLAAAISIAREACDALHAAHLRNVVHRDVKPGNIMVCGNSSGQEIVKLIDLSIARFGQDDMSLDLGIEPKLTRPGEVIGTPSYMAPEQLFQYELDHRCDIYAMGATLFECLAGCPPYPGGFGEVIMQLSTEPVPSVREFRPDIPPEVDAVIQRAMAREPADRFDDAFSLGVALIEATGLGLGSPGLLGVQSTPDRDIAHELRDRMATVAAPAPERRRKYPRAPYVTPIRIHHGGQYTDGRSEDIAEGGALVVLRHAVDDAPTGRPLPSIVQLVMAGPISGTVIQIKSAVRWSTPSSAGRLATGLEFVSLPDWFRDEIRSYVKGFGSPGG